MSQQYLIIDGYNLLHGAGLARPQYGPGDLERCRHKLLRALASRLTAEERKLTTIVFDAWDPPPERERVFHFEEMHVQFAEAPGEADAVIEELIALHSAPKQLTVVSGDRRLQVAAKRRKARFQDSETWYQQLDRREFADQQVKSEPTARERELTQQETEYWLGVFGDVDQIADDDASSARQGLPEVIDDDEFD